MTEHNYDEAGEDVNSRKMERNEHLDKVIAQVKAIGKPTDSPIAYVFNADGSMIISFIALSDKEETKMALVGLMIATGCKEMVFVQQCWMSRHDMTKPITVMPSDDPNHTDAFVIAYFSKDLTLVHSLEYVDDNGKCKWTGEHNYWENPGAEFHFNPFTKTEKEIEEMMELIKVKDVKSQGKKESIKLAYGHRMDVYRFEDKVCFECFDKDNEIFLKTKAMKDDDEFEDKFAQTKQIMKMMGDYMGKK